MSRDNIHRHIVNTFHGKESWRQIIFMEDIFVKIIFPIGKFTLGIAIVPQLLIRNAPTTDLYAWSVLLS